MNWSDPAPIPNCNVATPDFPALVIGFARSSDNAAYDLLTFNRQGDFRHYRAMHIGPVRVIRTHDDLKQVHDSVLRELYKETANPFTAVEDVRGLTHEELMGGIDLDTLRGIATSYEDTPMSDSNTATADSTETPSTKAAANAQAKAKERQEKKEAAEKKKAEAKAEREAKRSDGVIGNIKKELESESGTTVDEVLNKLVQKFPNRTRDGMSSTVKIQFSRLAKSTGRPINNKKIVGRGRVYKFADKGEIPGVEDTGAKEAPAASEAPAAPAADTPDTTLAGKKGARRPGGVKAAE